MLESEPPSIAQPPFRLSHTKTGFTLVEMMVVLGIMGLIVSVVIIAMPNQNRKLQEDAQKFAAKTAAMRDNAILQSRPMAVQVSRFGYSFVERRQGNWKPLNNRPFTPTNWSEGIMAKLADGDVKIVGFESTGLPSERITITLVRQNLVSTIEIAAMGDVRVLNDIAGSR